jgi:uncharacterized RDD family membrane protein YckC
MTGYAAEPVTLSGQYVLSGWWRRVGAACIDWVIIGVGAVVLLVAITAPFSVGFFASGDVGVGALFVGLVIGTLCAAAVSLLYAPAMMARTNGQTVGRQVTGIRVVRADGQPIGFGFAMVREVLVKALLVGVVSSATGGIAGLLDVLWPLWDEQHRALHDLVVDTRVVLV